MFMYNVKQLNVKRKYNCTARISLLYQSGRQVAVDQQPDVQYVLIVSTRRIQRSNLFRFEYLL